MKKALSVALVSALAFALAACSDDGESSSRAAKKADSSSAVETATAAPATTTAETTTTASEVTTTTTASATEPVREGFENLLGEWYIDGDEAAAHLSISADGSFQSFYATGSLEYEGSIKRLKADLGDGVGEAEYFCFFAKGGETPLFYVLDMGSESDEFYTVGGASLHFARAGKAAAFEMPENMPYNYYTTFGAGGSGVELHINADGTFEGLYTSPYTDEGGGQVVDFSHFTGVLKNAGKDMGGFECFTVAEVASAPGLPGEGSPFYGRLSEDTMTLTDLSELYGSNSIQQGETIHLYPQGTALDKLPADFTAHIGFFNESDEVLTEYVLYAEGSINIFVSQ